MATSYTIPTKIVAGDTVDVYLPIPGSQGIDSTWTGTARLTGPQGLAATTVTNDGTSLRIYFPGQGTGGTHILGAGQYLLTAWVTSGNDRITIGQYPLTVLEDLATDTAPTEPHAVVMLRVIEAAIQARVSGNTDGGIEGYAIDGTSVTKVPLDVLEKYRARYSAEVRALNNPNTPIGSVKFSFPTAGAAPDFRRRFGSVS